MTSFSGQSGWAKNDVTWRQANSTGMPPDQKVNKAKELHHVSINIEINLLLFLIFSFKLSWINWFYISICDKEISLLNYLLGIFFMQAH
jgi:hypothetical protein